MGLIKEIFTAGKDSVGGVLKDQWKDIIRCQDMGDNILMMKKTSASGVISNGSVIQVDPGQCAIIIDSGQVVDATAEEGVFTFDNASSPSFFAGDFGSTFQEMCQRFAYKGASSKEQSVYYFNIREITGNGFGTRGAVQYKDWEHAVANARVPGGFMAMSLGIKCFGTYTFKITDPLLFMREIAGTAAIFEKETLVEQLHSEILAAFQSVLNRLGTDEYRVPALDLPSKTFEIRAIMDREVLDEAIRNRGIRIISFAVEQVSLDDASKQKIEKWELSGDVHSQQGMLTEAYAQAMKSAAQNEAGAMNGFMGIGMMNMASGGMFQQVPGQVAGMAAAAPAAPAPASAQPAGGTYCTNCGTLVQGNFCQNCGTKVQAPQPALCKKCGAPVEGKFCASCGTPAEK